MSIKIDRDTFMPQIKRFAVNNRHKYQEQCVDLSDDVIEKAQAWFDLAPWEFGNKSDYDTRRECRISMKRFISSNISWHDNSKSYNLIPTFVFKWIAGYLITFIVKIIIEHYWDELSDEIGLGF